MFLGSVHRNNHEDSDGEQRYISTLSLTSPVDGVDGQRDVATALRRERDTLPAVHGAGWAPGLVWEGVKILHPTGVQSPYRPARSG
jgi:hypothetical protein